MPIYCIHNNTQSIYIYIYTYIYIYIRVNIYIYNTYTYTYIHIYICDMLYFYRFTQFEFYQRLIATCLSLCLLHLMCIYIYVYTCLFTPLLSSRYLDILYIFLHNFSMHLNLDSDLLSDGSPRRSITILIKSTYLM